MQEKWFGSGIGFAERFRNYHPKAETLANKEVLDLIGVDPCFKAISGFIKSEYSPISNQGTNVLVLGSGSGELPKYLSRTFPEAKVFSLDMAFEVFNRLRKLGSDDPLICSDVRKMPLVDNSFDVVVAHGVFRYIPEPLSAVFEANRVLKPGGMAFISEGKGIATMGGCYSKIINAERCLSFTPIPFRVDDVSMPRLTLFYALVENCEKDPDITKMLNKVKKEKPSLSDMQILFQIAGVSVDYIFGIEWTKSFYSREIRLSLF